MQFRYVACLVPSPNDRAVGWRLGARFMVGDFRKLFHLALFRLDSGQHMLMPSLWQIFAVHIAA